MADTAHKNITGVDLHEPKGVSTASSGQVYTANGSGSGSWTMPTTPGLVLIKSQSVSAVTEVDFVNGVSGVVLDNTYDDYRFVLSGITVSTVDSDIYMRVGTGGGPTYQTSAYSNTSGYGRYDGSAWTTNLAQNGLSEILLSVTYLAGLGLGGSSEAQLRCCIEFSNPDAAVFHTFLYSTTYVASTKTSTGCIYGSAFWDSATAITAIRFLPSTGTFSGRFSLYGYKYA